MKNESTSIVQVQVNKQTEIILRGLMLEKMNEETLKILGLLPMSSLATLSKEVKK